MSTCRSMTVLLILLSIKVSDGLFSCPQSAPTIAFVGHCPMNKAEWDRAAERKNCNSMAARQNCTDAAKFQYHCLLNHHRNATLEVCAPIFYLQGYCPIYNDVTKDISENYNPGYECLFFGKEQCPSRYPSSEAYKYQQCYRTNSAISKLTEFTSERDSRNEDIFKYIFLVSLPVMILAIVFLVIILICKKKILKWKEKHFANFCKTGKETTENAPNAEGVESNPLLSNAESNEMEMNTKNETKQTKDEAKNLTGTKKTEDEAIPETKETKGEAKNLTGTKKTEDEAKAITDTKETKGEAKNLTETKETKDEAKNLTGTNGTKTTEGVAKALKDKKTPPPRPPQPIKDKNNTTQTKEKTKL